MADETQGDGAAPVVALVADLIFASRIRGVAAQASVPAVTVQREEELLGAVREKRPRVVLVDLDARAVDGPEVVGRLKAEAALEGVPVVGFVSHVNREAIEAAREAGADRVLARSAFVKELPTLVRGTDTAPE